MELYPEPSSPLWCWANGALPEGAHRLPSQKLLPCQAPGEQVAQDSKECSRVGEEAAAASTSDKDGHRMRAQQACFKERGYSCYPFIACPTL